MGTTFHLSGYQFAKDLIFGWTIVAIGSSDAGAAVGLNPYQYLHQK